MKVPEKGFWKRRSAVKKEEAKDVPEADRALFCAKRLDGGARGLYHKKGRFQGVCLRVGKKERNGARREKRKVR